jgi:hypothetical protein
MKIEISLPAGTEITRWVMPDRQQVKERYREAFDKRVLALRAVIGGSAISAASLQFGVDRTTLTEMLRQASLPAADGKALGFRVCIPWYRKQEATVRTSEVPSGARPHVFGGLLRALPELARLITSYKDRLPTHNRPSPKFDALFRKFKKVLKDSRHELSYPLNTRDQGRRALQNWIKRQRTHLRDLKMADNDDHGASVTRLDHIFQLQPLDRVEFDGHHIDNDWHALVPTRDGQWTTALVSKIWLLAIIDVVSLVVLACTLVIGEAYDTFDVMETFAKALTPWKPRELIVPKMQYASNAWMPSMVETPGQILRTVSVALDNAWAHRAIAATENLGDHLLGVVNLGYPHVPEGRPNVEAFFKRMEDRVLRFIAGGYRPAKGLGDEKENVSGKLGKDYPVDTEALNDLVDVAVSAYNTTPHPALQNRTPREVYESHLRDGIWTIQSGTTREDASELLTLHFHVTIRGSKPKGVLPHVRCEGARYRSRKLNARYDLIGKAFRATVHWQSAHQIALWDDDGNLFVVLEALRPWHTPHSLRLRKTVLRHRRSGLIEIEGAQDAVDAYNQFVRTKASELQWATDEYLKLNLQKSPSRLDSAPKSPYAHLDTLAGLKPRVGSVDLTSRGKK